MFMTQHLSIMIVGSGAREHTLSNAYESSPQVNRIIVVPGNDFIGYKRQKEVVIDNECSLKDPNSILALAKKYKPYLVDVAQDDALAHGVVNLLEDNGFLVFGPRRSAARIEWDKRWSREFMQRHGISQPDFRYFNDEDSARRYAEEIYREDVSRLTYTKASGLCSGKGALKSTSLDQTLQNIERMKTFPDRAGEVFLIEEGLVGEEFSYYAISDGKTYHVFKSAQDNKTVLNFDESDQTGGMGAISPARVTEPFAEQIEQEMISRAIRGMASEGNHYKGVLYLGGFIVEGKPMNIEYNARWGDPECQVVLPSVETDYVDIVSACLEERLDKTQIQQDNKTRVCVVGSSRGYPNHYSKVKGKRIYGLEEAMEMDGIRVFGAGVDVEDGKFYANGGRLFSVVAEGKNILEAKQRAYSAMARISIEGNNLHYRTDIGWRDVERFLKEHL
jgi:phosphoribosylamine---glycine ligase